MDNHIHLIVAGDNLAGIIKDFKRHTARKIIDKATEEEKDWLLNQFTKTIDRNTKKKVTIRFGRKVFIRSR